jgi:hypothetical protein
VAQSSSIPLVVGASSSGTTSASSRDSLGDELGDIQSDCPGLIGEMEEGLLRRVLVSGALTEPSGSEALTSAIATLSASMSDQ